MNSVTLHSPAKINLMLSVHGRRNDGFHGLTSLVVPIAFGDTLQVAIGEAGQDRLSCRDVSVPRGGQNLIIQAAAALRAASGRNVYFDIELNKQIPMGAGLGGGSSNASVALIAMNQLLDSPLCLDELSALAARLGSDCPFFLHSQPMVMTGRGEALTGLPGAVSQQLRGRTVLLFRPHFGIQTAWAYGKLVKAGGGSYEAEPLATQRLQQFYDSGRIDNLLYNSFERSVGSKYLAIACLLEELRCNGIACLMSGSGSCCFALPRNQVEQALIEEICQNAWGSDTFFIETSIL
ncbi:4-(cytidine 5'-diphospho)-2-C-methyl-D-erythritol kinase [Coraliomargarita sp. SDUM461004]|uniref:4-diphosphocytidyl-2-C-methyl-D-erythritol kinase n=1 Tax=Thalassobacterium sedimentorum TaxID=3041258 RepID=A0ABU1AJR6_9BACT|nr:4-(cytidine 5'-diphospho)-2-C-methyl-D-erythritol kinase [Coraliomargarita sp. SDUM461004]MDQ8193853.1 4-(cytidine 5'-diphospho)-2-C-methyl-D-erythritol kinase [Coraliomargarita sp. SDUM461004]